MGKHWINLFQDRAMEMSCPFISVCTSTLQDISMTLTKLHKSYCFLFHTQNTRSMGRLNHFCSTLFLFLSFTNLSPSHADNRDECVYTVYVRTGSILKAGTDSIISLTLYDTYGEGIRVVNLEAWGGLMGPGYNYFERGNLDIFSGKGPCLSAPMCAMNLTSDGSGLHHGWYCNYVEVTSTGAHIPCAQNLFTVEQWLATDTSPYQLTAIRNNCPSSDPDQLEKRNGRDLIGSLTSIM